jgi:hypothetical protein
VKSIVFPLFLRKFIQISVQKAKHNDTSAASTAKASAHDFHRNIVKSILIPSIVRRLIKISIQKAHHKASSAENTA